MNSELIKQYYSLTKPRVLYGNVITGAAGFFLASGHYGSFSINLFLSTIIGMTLVIASACALNNYLDQDIDRIMERTKSRVVASGLIPGRNAVFFSITLAILGFLVLIVGTNLLVVAIGAAGFVTYVWLYGALSKRLTVHGTAVGSLSGAAPILAGYCAVSGSLNIGAVAVFLMLFFWQFPEFYSIAIYRLKEYKQASIPVMPVVYGVPVTKIQILIYTVLFTISVFMLNLFGYIGWTYLLVMAACCAYWLKLAVTGLNIKDNDRWARKMFHFSLIVLLILSFMISIGPLLP